MVARFVAGETLAEALEALDDPARRPGSPRRSTSWASPSAVPEAATAAADRYLDTLDALRDRGLDGNVSLKLTQMGLDLDPALCRANLARIFGRAAETGAFVRVDMEDHTKTDATLDLWRSVRVHRPGQRGRHPGRPPAERRRRRAAHRRGGADPAVQGRLQRAGLGRLRGQGRGRRELSSAHGAAPRRRPKPGLRDPRRGDDRPRRPLRPGARRRARPVRVPDALRDPARSPGAPAPGRVPGPDLRARTVASGTPTSCAGWPSARPT